MCLLYNISKSKKEKWYFIISSSTLSILKGYVAHYLNDF